jgi:nucleotide-binding universal stress UspA family protein
MSDERAHGNGDPHPHVLVCLDRSFLAERVIPHALALTRGRRARITLLHVLEADHRNHALPTDPLAWQLHAAEARRYVDALAARHRTRELSIDAVVTQGHPAEQIRAWAAAHHVDVTVLCSHGQGGRTEWRLASTAQKLVAGVPGPVLLVPATSAHSTPAVYARILVPVDGSAHAESVLPLATGIARAHGAELVLVHVVPMPELTCIGPLSAEDQELERRFVERNEAIGRAYLDRIRARFVGPDVPIRTVLSRGPDVRNGLVHVVERERADLVVVSASGRSGRTHEPCGSVTAHLMAHSPAPLLVVRERTQPARRQAAPRHHDAVARMPAQAAP